MMRRRIGNILIWSLLALGGGAALFLALLFYRPSALPQRTDFSPAQLRSAEQAIALLEGQAREIRQAAARRRPGRFECQARADEVNAYLAAHPERLTSRWRAVRGLQVEFEGNQVQVKALVSHHGRELHVHTSGFLRLSPDGRRVTFVPETVGLGALPLPPFVQRRLVAEIERRIASPEVELPSYVQVEQITAQDGVLRVQGRVLGSPDLGNLP